jgi:hypothetical protein
VGLVLDVELLVGVDRLRQLNTPEVVQFCDGFAVIFAARQETQRQ